MPEATRYFERALRYAPDDAMATAGLGRALLRLGKPARAVVLLERAIELAPGAAGVSAPALIDRALIDLAEVLAGPLEDRSQAVSRVRQVPDDSPHAAQARVLEAQWRASLGDAAGAALAYARMRALLELNPPEAAPKSETERKTRASAIDWLLSAAQHADAMADVHGERAHVALALALAPNDPRVTRRYALLFPSSETAAPVTDSVASMPSGPSVGHSVADVSVTPAPPSQTRLAPEADDREDAVRAEELQDQLRARPDDDDVASELANVLQRLGRHLDLFALVCARVDEIGGMGEEGETAGDRELRARWLDRLRDVAGELGRRARERGHADEAELYEATVARFS